MGLKLWFAQGSMAENYGLVPAIIGVEKVFANPEQIFFALIFQGDPGTKSGVDKEVVLGLEVEAQIVEKLQMIRWNRQLPLFPITRKGGFAAVSR